MVGTFSFGADLGDRPFYQRGGRFHFSSYLTKIGHVAKALGSNFPPWSRSVDTHERKTSTLTDPISRAKNKRSAR
jgi:hypothetical protein